MTFGWIFLLLIQACYLILKWLAILSIKWFMIQKVKQNFLVKCPSTLDLNNYLLTFFYTFWFCKCEKCCNYQCRKEKLTKKGELSHSMPMENSKNSQQNLGTFYAFSFALLLFYDIGMTFSLISIADRPLRSTIDSFIAIKH